MKLGTLCYIESGDAYLMLHRTKKINDMHKDLWVGLGGKLEPGESPEECVKREVFEESGLTIQNPRLRGILTFPGFFDEEDWYVFLYVTGSFTGELSPCNEGELSWIAKNSLDALPMHEDDRYFLRWINENLGIFSAKYVYEDGVLTNYEISVYD